MTSYLQYLIRERHIVFDDGNLQANFCETNLRGNAVCQCQHPVRTDDRATAYV